MAPSSNRRPGNSRRAQYSTFFGYIAGVLGAVTGAVLLIVSVFDPSAFASARGRAAQATAPVAVAGSEVRGASRGFFEIVEGYILAGSRGAKMQSDLRLASVQLAEMRATADENRRLKALLGIASEQPRPIAITKLTSSSAASTRRFAVVDAGRNKAVTVGMPVRSPLGLIGRVLEVGESSARVLLVTDTESVVPVRRAADGVAGFAQGRGDGRLQIRLISLGINPLRKGDVFVTSGSGGLYRPGIAVAAVTETTRDGAIAQVLSDPAATDYVLVEPLWSETSVAMEALPPPPLAGSRKTGAR